LDDAREDVPGELAGLAREARVAVREEDLDLAHPARVEEPLPRRGIARRVLGPEVAEVVVAHRDPRRLPRPARLNQLAVVGEHRLHERDRAWGAVLLPARGELESGDRDLQHYLILAPWESHCPSRSRSVWVMWVALPSGMNVESTATPLICAASWWICSGVSRTTPAGAELKPGWVGCSEWQGAQRFWTTR